MHIPHDEIQPEDIDSMSDDEVLDYWASEYMKDMMGWPSNYRDNKTKVEDYRFQEVLDEAWENIMLDDEVSLTTQIFADFAYGLGGDDLYSEVMENTDTARTYRALEGHPLLRERPELVDDPRITLATIPAANRIMFGAGQGWDDVNDGDTERYGEDTPWVALGNFLEDSFFCEFDDHYTVDRKKEVYDKIYEWAQEQIPLEGPRFMGRANILLADSNLDPEHKDKVIRYFNEMCDDRANGQKLDNMFEIMNWMNYDDTATKIFGNQPGERDATHMNSAKNSYFKHLGKMAAAVADAGPEDFQVARTTGAGIGLMYQGSNDIEDVWEDLRDGKLSGLIATMDEEVRTNFEPERPLEEQMEVVDEVVRVSAEAARAIEKTQRSVNNRLDDANFENPERREHLKEITAKISGKAEQGFAELKEDAP